MQRFKATPFSLSATVTTSTDVGTALQPEGRATDLLFEAYNSGGTNALTAFILYGKFHSAGEWIQLLAGTDWDSAAGLLKFKSGTLKTLGTTTRGAARVDVTGLWALKFVASSTSTPLAIKGMYIEQ